MSSIVDWLPQVLAAVLIFLGGAIAARWNRRSAIEKTNADSEAAKATKDVAVGQIMLAYAEKLGMRLTIAEQKLERLEEWEDDVIHWSKRLDLPWHAAVTTALVNCECHRVHDIPPLVAMPTLKKEP